MKKIYKTFFGAALTAASVGIAWSSISVEAKLPFIPDGSFPSDYYNVEEELKFNDLYFHLEEIYKSNDPLRTTSIPFSFKCESLFDLNESSIQIIKTAKFDKNGRAFNKKTKMKANIKTKFIYQDYTLQVPAEGYRQCFAKVDVTDSLETFDFKNGDPLNGYTWQYSTKEYNQVNATTNVISTSHDWYAQFEVKLQVVDINSVWSANYVPYPEYTAVIKAYSKNNINCIIYNQNDLEALTYGNKNFTYNGCGPIAASNALKLKTGKTNLYDVKKYFEDNNYVIFDGALGTNPVGITAFLESNKLIESHEYVAPASISEAGFQYWYNTEGEKYLLWYIKTGKNDELNNKFNQKENAIAIVFVANDGNDIYAGAHYFVIEKKNGYYKTYNNSNATSSTSVNELFGKSICLAYWFID